LTASCFSEASTAADDEGPGGFVELRFEMASLLQEKNIMRCSNNKKERAVPNETLQFSSFVLKGGEKKASINQNKEVESDCIHTHALLP
jgi:hypothetical protein